MVFAALFLLMDRERECRCRLDGFGGGTMRNMILLLLLVVSSAASSEEAPKTIIDVPRARLCHVQFRAVVFDPEAASIVGPPASAFIAIMNETINAKKLPRQVFFS